MADARSLLRQQRLTRRVQHPHAFYSDAGKLLCTVCREQIRVESQWDDHIKSQGHQQRLHKAQEQASVGNSGIPESSSATGKRKLLQEEGDDVLVTEGLEEAPLPEDGSRRKRSRADLLSELESTPVSNGSHASTLPTASSFKDTPGEPMRDTPPKSTTPPSLTRRASATPSQGVEIQIPSRPATPSHRRDGSTASTPLISNGFNGVLNGGNASNDKAQASRAAGSALTAALSSHFPVISTSSSSKSAAVPTAEVQPVDENEWAAFEADIASLPQDDQANVFDASAATISAAPMTASESLAARQAAAAQQGEAEPVSVEESADRLRQLEKQRREADKEEADRALEMEFEEMEELEGRVRKLKERREQLRRTQSQGQGDRPAMDVEDKTQEKENAMVEGGQEDDEESSDDDDDDDWDGFRFRGR